VNIWPDLFFLGSPKTLTFQTSIRAAVADKILLSFLPLMIFLLFQFVANGVFKAELNEFLMRELAEDGYSGVEVRVTPTKTEIIIMATRTQNVLGERGRRIRELTAVVQKR
jgi:KH domain